MARSIVVAAKALSQTQSILRAVSTNAAGASTNTRGTSSSSTSSSKPFSTAAPTHASSTTTPPSSPKKASWFSALFGGGYSSQPKAHRPFGPNEKAHLTLATRKKDKVMLTNPGARVEPNFLPADQSQILVEEAMEVIKKYGISHVNEEQRSEMAHQLKHFPLPKAELKCLINMQRVTGVRSAWGGGGRDERGRE